jgi:hypothetical protein
MKEPDPKLLSSLCSETTNAERSLMSDKKSKLQSSKHLLMIFFFLQPKSKSYPCDNSMIVVLSVR